LTNYRIENCLPKTGKVEKCRVFQLLTIFNGCFFVSINSQNCHFGEVTRRILWHQTQICKSPDLRQTPHMVLRLNPKSINLQKHHVPFQPIGVHHE